MNQKDELERICQEDTAEEVFEAIYSVNWNDLHSYASGMCSPNDLDDVLQFCADKLLAFTRESLAQKKRPNPQYLRRWSFTVVRNKCIDIFRNSNNKTIRLDNLEITADNDDSIADFFEYEKIAKKVEDVFRTVLNIQEQAVFAMRLHGMKSEDIAKTLDIERPFERKIVSEARRKIGEGIAKVIDLMSFNEKEFDMTWLKEKINERIRKSANGGEFDESG